MLGALTGGVLLNLMPCVFPILCAEGAAPLARSGGAPSEGAPRRTGLHRRRGGRHRRARRGAARDPSRRQRGGLGIPAAGPAHDHPADAARQRQSRSTCVGAVQLCLAIGGRARPTRAASPPARSPPSSRRPAPGRSSAPRSAPHCCFPPAGSVAGVRRARSGAGDPVPAQSRFIPALARAPAQAGAVDGAASSASWPSRWRRPRSACLWLLWRQAGGPTRMALRLVALAALAACCLSGSGLLQRKGQSNPAIGRRWPRGSQSPLLAVFGDAATRGDQQTGPSKAWSLGARRRGA